MTDFDVAIVGSGFGGSVLAMIARRLGLSVVLLERGRHPRFAIGESASPLAGVVLEQLAETYDLPRLKPLATFGAWRRHYPQVTCGLKRGFTYFKHEAGKPFRPTPDRRGELLVAASPSDEVSDTHWLRADVDAFLVQEAITLGVEYLDLVELDALAWDAADRPVLTGRRAGQPLRLRAGVVVDASGPRGFLSRVMGPADRGFEGYPATQALFSHFTGVARCDELPDFDLRSGGLPPLDDRAARSGSEPPPYPVDDAALHHVFDEGWMWVLRFGNGVTSAGVAVTDRFAAELRLADGAAAWDRLLARYPSVAAQFADAAPIREFTWMPRLPWRAPVACAPRIAMLPSAAAFIDPLFSTGIPLTLLGIERLAPVLSSGRFEHVAAVTLAEADHTARFIRGCYAAFPRFEVFAAFSMFYFVAASFSEMARRAAPGRASRGFLCAADETFCRAMDTLSPARGMPADAGRYAERVAAAVEYLNIAGLCDPAKRNWYGVDLDDPVRHASKLGVDADAVRRALDAVHA